MREILEVAIAAAREAGRIQRQRVGRLGHVEYKEANDPVTEVDLLCEREIIRRIQERFPGHDILAEESGGREGVSSPHKWIIDPLDGTINYAHGTGSRVMRFPSRLKVRVCCGRGWPTTLRSTSCSSLPAARAPR